MPKICKKMLLFTNKETQIKTNIITGLLSDWHRLKSLLRQLKRWVAYKYCHTLVISVITVFWKTIWQYLSTKTF